ncbi:hypothetical protein Hanom_Chr12g01074091 [Helianthus anomalus]
MFHFFSPKCSIKSHNEVCISFLHFLNYFSLNVEDGSLKVQRRGLLMHIVFGSLFAPAMVPLAFAEEGKHTLKLNMQYVCSYL